MQLRDTHPNFLISYGFTAAFHSLAGLGQIVAPESLFNSPTGEFVYYLPRQWWGVIQLAIGLIMVLGLFVPDWRVAKYALAAGTAVCVSRAILLTIALIAGEGGVVGIPLYLWAAGVSAAMTMEPPENPNTRRT